VADLDSNVADGFSVEVARVDGDTEYVGVNVGSGVYVGAEDEEADIVISEEGVIVLIIVKVIRGDREVELDLREVYEILGDTEFETLLTGERDKDGFGD
jgi:hypothetical protein